MKDTPHSLKVGNRQLNLTQFVIYKTISKSSIPLTVKDIQQTICDGLTSERRNSYLFSDFASKEKTIKSCEELIRFRLIVCNTSNPTEYFLSPRIELIDQ